MTKRYALAFAAVGYLFVVWYYAAAFAPLRSGIGLTVLWHACLFCGSNDAIGSGVPVGAVILVGPVNAALCGIVGSAVGKAIEKVKTRLWQYPPDAMK